jgi:hypothetical protein
MIRDNAGFKELRLGAWGWFIAFRLRSKFFPLILVALLSLTTLACALLGPNARSTPQAVIIRNRLPTLTPTSLPAQTPPVTAIAAVPPTQPDPVQLPTTAAPAAAAAVPIPSATASQNMEPASAPVINSAPPPAEVAVTPTPLPTAAPVAVATETPTPTSVPTEAPTMTPSPTPPAWLFTGVRTSPAPDGNGLFLYGDMVNNTGSSQTLQFISATFYDAQGQIISPADITDYWPTEAVPPGGQIPFELNVAGVPGNAGFDLNVEALPSDQTPRQDFEFSDLNQSGQDGDYCLSGSLRDQGSELQEYLVIVAVLYDPQNNVINFGDYFESDPGGETDEHTLDFELCVDSLGQNVARHELRAWGL